MMNLVGDPWIPVVFEDGHNELVSLENLYENAESIRDLSANPAQRIALTRLLLCITQAALDGPADEDDWKTCQPRIVPASLKYLREKRTLFDLFGERPFLQVAALTATNNAVLDKLDFGSAAGNNPNLFDHGAIEDGRVHKFARAILSLLTFQCFSPGGTIGVTTWGGVQTAKNSEHAPCLESSPLHTILRGRNVLEKMWLNVLSKQILQTRLAIEMGRPIWEQICATPTPKPEWTQTYLGRMIPMSRGILLDRDLRQCTFVNGFSYAKLPDYREPMLTVSVIEGKKGQEYRYLPLRLERHPWRELNSVLNMNRKDKAGGPLALDHLSQLSSGVIDIWTGGLAADKGKLLDMADWVVAVPVQLLNEGCMTVYGQGVELARQGESCLREAIKVLASDLKMQEYGGFFQKATLSYWSSLDARYGQLMDCATTVSMGLKPWADLIREAMQHAFRDACPSDTPRQMKAFVLGQKKLYLKEQKHD